MIQTAYQASLTGLVRAIPAAIVVPCTNSTLTLVTTYLWTLVHTALTSQFNGHRQDMLCQTGNFTKLILRCYIIHNACLYYTVLSNDHSQERNRPFNPAAASAWSNANRVPICCRQFSATNLCEAVRLILMMTE